MQLITSLSEIDVSDSKKVFGCNVKITRETIIFVTMNTSSTDIDPSRLEVRNLLMNRVAEKTFKLVRMLRIAFWLRKSAMRRGKLDIDTQLDSESIDICVADNLTGSFGIA
jgi:hypothetical protein